MEFKTGNLYYDVPEDDYYNDSAISNSDLKLISESPKDWKAGIREVTDAMQKGRAFHCYIGEREKFKKTYAKSPLVYKIDEKTGEILGIEEIRHDKRTAKYKALEAKFGAKEIMKHSDFRDLYWTKQSIKSDVNAQALLGLPGQNEVSGWFEYEGVICRFRADRITRKGNKHIIIDYKKLSTSNNKYLTEKTIEYYNRAYGCTQQAAFYRVGLASILGVDLSDVLFVNIYMEMNSAKRKSLGCVAALIPEDLLIGEHGEMKFHNAICDYKYYQANGWPTHSECIVKRQIDMGIIQGGIPSIGIGGWM